MILISRLVVLNSQFWQFYRRFRFRMPDPTIRIGRNVEIRAESGKRLHLSSKSELKNHVRVRGDVIIEQSSSIRDYVFLDARGGYIKIGKHCSINDYCVLYGMGGLTIGDDVRIATHTVIVTAEHEFADVDTAIRLQGISLKPVSIEDDVWIGMNVSILGGVTIGKGSIIGAGSVVTKSIPSMSVAVGNPARVVRTR